MVEKKTKMKKSVKYFFLPTLLILLAYYLFLDVINKPPTIKIIDPNLKYILQWTRPETEPFAYMGKGQDTFIKKNCPVNNCYITADRTFLKELTDFDAVLFHGPELERDRVIFPKVRSPRQQYVFVSMESSHYYPLTKEKYDNFFNWTWTYKLNSDLYYGYIIIRNDQDDVIGPKRVMHWLKPEQMEPIDDELKQELSTKRLAAAWMVSNCATPSKREDYVEKMQVELAKYNLSVDIYGKCGSNTCPRSDSDNRCQDMVKKHYYFYLSFENSFSEDYVTEKLLTAVQNNAVPVVYGGANYTRFLPDGAYLDARKLGVEKLVQEMVEAINNTQKYYDFFKWRNHYSYHSVGDTVETNAYCHFCNKVNIIANNTQSKRKLRFYRYFRKWWNTQK